MPLVTITEDNFAAMTGSSKTALAFVIINVQESHLPLAFVVAGVELVKPRDLTSFVS